MASNSVSIRNLHYIRSTLLILSNDWPHRQKKASWLTYQTLKHSLSFVSTIKGEKMGSQQYHIRK